MNKTSPRLQLLTLNSILLALIISLSSFTTQQDSAKRSTFRFKTVVIDAGHGGKDPGTHGLHSNEKTVALSIARKLRAAIQDQIPNVNTVMTRSDDTFIPLDRRSAIANEHNGNLFISIHCNSSPEGTGYSDHKQKGTMMLVYGFHRVKEQLEAIRENASIMIEKDYKTKYQSYDENDPVNRILLNAYMQKYRKQSILFGDLLNAEFKGQGRQTIGVKEQGILVLAHSAMPAVMIETGFINNPADEEYLTSDAGQDEIVQVIISALKDYKTKTTVQ
ncbi:N-acetylmuramoyl-L-alanine amidase [Mucilaginibacter sp. UR6-11]|uniref:N-acetylmuramoyl-L-alanine amidase family protein n=1 Tax=Mucilaginibacter sp. UR6-11 TaxID=1435644 RepID=UPI001E349FB4|nr:N-acetylmuramoyl-L-alanine amidase [Mucilaginibacter sp. UR6-11]MCC8424808.1 N-acetylmuramoyl-L-alanine amidase [Mucilaginibacter sp. UR6-11]